MRCVLPLQVPAYESGRSFIAWDFNSGWATSSRYPSASSLFSLSIDQTDGCGWHCPHQVVPLLHQVWRHLTVAWLLWGSQPFRAKGPPEGVAECQQLRTGGVLFRTFNGNGADSTRNTTTITTISSPDASKKELDTQ
jgi:hypothetical protein